MAETAVMGLFIDEESAAAMVRELRNSPWKLSKVHSPFPSHKISDALALKKSKVGYYTLAGGIIGFFAGFALAAFTATRWDLIVSGKPVVALVPFFIVGFEFTILFSVLGNVVGLITQAGLPEYNWDHRYDPRCTGHHFGIVAECPAEERDRVAAFFVEKGAEVRLFDD
jgi:molybdopterin-containing oxidoreductase family membrane subunit